jgi:hypothetical protein
MPPRWIAQSDYSPAPCKFRDLLSPEASWLLSPRDFRTISTFGLAATGYEQMTARIGAIVVVKLGEFVARGIVAEHFLEIGDFDLIGEKSHGLQVLGLMVKMLRRPCGLLTLDFLKAPPYGAMLGGAYAVSSGTDEAAGTRIFVAG